MAKQRETYLTFSVTVPQPKGMTIPDVRAALVDGIKSCWPEPDLTIKAHLTNKEVKYGA